jgi:hypothetical protein
MPDISRKAKGSRSGAALVTTLLWATLVPAEGSAQNSSVLLHQGRVIGHIDRIRFFHDQFHIAGWACQLSAKDSIDVHIYADHSAYGTPRGTLVLAGKANLESEPAVNRTCQDQEGGKHRFEIALPSPILAIYRGRKLFVHGIRLVGGSENSLIAGSGTLQFPSPPLMRKGPAVYPRLAGAYKSLAQHPRVFMTESDLKDLTTRINSPGTFSAQSFARLTRKVKADHAAKVDWDAAYSGCDVEIYLRGFSFEPKPAYGNDRTEDELRAAMNVRLGEAPPHGAAVVASRLALYAALVKAGALAPADAPTSEEAAALVKRILLAWADRGFRDEQGNFRRSQSQVCDLDPTGKPVVTQFGQFVGALTFARGVIYSIHAQDLLDGLHALSPQEETRLNAFHREMYDWIRNTRNEEFNVNMKWKYSDEVYNNQFAGHLVALLAAARLLDDEKAFEAALYGGEGERTVVVPWVTLFDHVIYGPSDTPLLNITPNSTDDPLTSRPAYTTKVVAAGEINDRYRNSNPTQGIGYSMGTLEGLFHAAEILRIAGFDPYGYRGAHNQSIEMATQYYACYGKYVGFYKTVTADNARACSNYQQYVGKIVNDVDSPVLIGAYRFPKNDSITGVEAAARVAWSSTTHSLDAIRFGRWRE